MACVSDPRPPDDQTDVVAFLTSGIPPGAEPVRRIDTHAAMIFLAGDRAWKLKRAVRFPYLDFSDAGRRHAALDAELRLNRRTAPALYRAVHSINRDPDGGLAIDGPGGAIDWILEMRRFPDAALLATVAARGELDIGLAMRLADRIAAFHAGAEVALVADGEAVVRAVADGNRESMARYPAILPAAQVAELHRRTIGATARAGGLLRRRAQAGRVRHCHGDLHLANIVLLDGEPTLFDCLEFDPRLATIDLLYDLAFLLMDLWASGLRLQANAVFNRYLDVSPDDEPGAALLPLFMSIRAAVRAHVHAARARSADDDAGRQARAYIGLASRMLDFVPPRLVAIGGLSGTGKSTLARALAGLIGHAPGARILRSDVLRKRLAGLPPETPLPRATYTPEASHHVYAGLIEQAGSLLKTGQSVVADAVFADRAERDAMHALATGAGVPFDGLWLEAAIDVRVDRIGGRGADASDANTEVARRQPVVPADQIAGWHRIDAGADADAIAAAARHVLALA